MTVAISAVLVAIAANALTGSRKVARVTGRPGSSSSASSRRGPTRSARGASQGYYIGQNGAGAGGPDANTAFVFWKLNPPTRW